MPSMPLRMVVMDMEPNEGKLETDEGKLGAMVLELEGILGKVMAIYLEGMLLAGRYASVPRAAYGYPIFLFFPE